MEQQVLLVLGGLGVTVGVVLVLMWLFSGLGTSYEQAQASQRQVLMEPKVKAPTKKEKKKKRREIAVKGSEVETENEVPAESGGDEDAAEGPRHVEFSPPVEVEVPDTPPNVKIRKRGKDPKVKPILVNKEDPSCISDPSAATTPDVISNHFEELHPKDEFELKLSAASAEKSPEKAEAVEKAELKAAPSKAGRPKPAPEPAREEAPRPADQPKEQRKVKKSEKKVVEEVAEAPVAAAAPAPASTASPPGGKSKKKKQELGSALSLMAGDAGVNAAELESVLRAAPLSHAEIEALITLLCDRQDQLPRHSEWTKGPNDPMQKLKKQLAEKEKAFTESEKEKQDLQVRAKELREKLNAEKSRGLAAARATEAAEQAARAELLALQARLQRALDDNAALAQDKHVLQSKLSMEGEAQAQRVQMEMHIQSLSESENALVAQLGALQAELAARAVDTGMARDAAAAAQLHAADLMQQLQEASQARVSLEARAAAAELAEQRASQELRQAQERLAAAADLQAEVQRLSTSSSAADKLKEQLAEARSAKEDASKQLAAKQEELDKQKEQTEALLEKLKEQAEKQKQQLSSELSSAHEQVSARGAELAAAREELAALRLAPRPAQNGLPPAAEQKANDLAKVEKVVESLSNELKAAKSSNSEQREQLARLQDQLAGYQLKNNEAIAKAQEAQYNEVVNILRAACPAAAAAPGAPAGRDWLHAFADNLKKELQQREAEKKLLEKQTVNQVAAAPDSRLKDLSAQNKELQGTVDKYKRIIDETEGILSRLQHNVTAEEQRWAQKLDEKQRELEDLRTKPSLQEQRLSEQLALKQHELDDLRQRTVLQLQTKIDSLEKQLQKAANHSNNSFADSERLAEEKLMIASLSNKQNTDVCNGPSQVGLGSK